MIWKNLWIFRESLGLTVTRETTAGDGSFKLVYLGDGVTPHLLELTWLRDMDRPYNLGDNEFHLAFHTDNFEKAHELHKEMGCICFENEAMASTSSLIRMDTGWRSVHRYFMRLYITKVGPPQKAVRTFFLFP